MKNVAIVVLATALCAGTILAQTPAPAKAPAAPKAAAAAAPDSSVSDELKKIENDWLVAAKAKDAVKLGEILADSWTGISWDGKMRDKAQSLAELKATGNSLDTFEMGPLKVRVFGNTAVVTGSDTEKSMEKGKDSSGTYLWMDVFVKQDGKWRAVASESSKVIK